MKILSITRPLPCLLILIFSSWRIEVKFLLVNCEPLSVLKYSGFPLSSASFKTPQQISGSRVLEIHHSHKVDESMLQTDAGDISCPRHVRFINGYIPEKIRIDLMFLVWKAQSLPGINCLHPQYPNQSPGFVTTNFELSPLQLPAPVYGKVQVNFIHFLKNSLILLSQSDPFIIERGPVERENLALPPNPQLLVVLFHKLSLYRLWICLYFFFRNSSSMFCFPIFLYSSSFKLFSSSISGSFFLEKRPETFSKSCFFHFVI